ncbi:MAG: hypothetical protein Q8P57_01900 [Candidatus Pacearchaeota archaeon]|nr:hypothetical protein [Candidatus Pacearchaeota archaeon]
MVDLSWCKKQKNGIKFIKPSDNLSKEYFKYIGETLSVLGGIECKSNMWLATSKYYSEYFCAYSILMKIGIKCEIHDCTIGLCKLLEKEGILFDGFAKTLEEDKELRIDNQYYLKNRKVKIDNDALTEFLLRTKEILNRLNYDMINKIRGLLE